jgi:hypothetical protein
MSIILYAPVRLPRRLCGPRSCGERGSPSRHRGKRSTALVTSAVAALGIDSGDVRVNMADTAAVQVMSLVDGLSVQAAMRDMFDYSDVRAFVTAAAGQIPGIRLSN